MPRTTDVSVNLPAEYFDALSEVLAVGFQHAKINPLILRELKAWWEAEKTFIQDDLDNQT